MLAARVRDYLSDQADVEEKAMMGGLVFMVNQKMCVGIIKNDLMCRIHPDMQHELVEQPGCRMMDMMPRPMKGFIVVEENALRTSKALGYWIDLALAFNPLAQSAKKKKK